MNKIFSFGWLVVQPFWVVYLRIVKKCIIEKRVRLSYLSVFEGKNKLGEATKFIESTLGYASYVGEHSYFYNTQIGKYTCIGPRVKTVVGQHPINNFASIHPVFYSTRTVCGFSYVTKDKFEQFRCCNETDRSVIIGNDVWIGSDVLIMEGVHIGDGAIIGAGAIVLHDVEPYTIVAGVPAKCIKARFDSKTVSDLLNYKWWEKDADWIEEYAYLFEDVHLLLEKIKSK